MDKARDTISEIEEIKRKELQMVENMHTLHPRFGLMDTSSLSAVSPLHVVGEYPKLILKVAFQYCPHKRINGR